MSFTFVQIPANKDNPIEELTASKAGGLEHDELVQHAKKYFQQQANADRPSCDIMALTIPVAGNNYQAVSLYASDYGIDATENTRATQLVTACGHSLPEPIRGDVFVGRAHDNEASDVWQRMDFTAQDADPTSQWCRTARSSGGGGGQGGSASSLSGIVQQQLNQANTQVIAPNRPAALYGKDGTAAVEETWGKWTQNDEEVELKLKIPVNTKPKIVFKRNQLMVSIQDETKIEGTLFGPIVPDECTYTMESVGDEKELCITLTKAEEGATWSFLTAAK